MCVHSTDVMYMYSALDMHRTCSLNSAESGFGLGDPALSGTTPRLVHRLRADSNVGL